MKSTAKERFVDKAALYGAPIVFVALVVMLIWLLIRHDSKRDPIALLHDGIATVGASRAELESKLGPPAAEWSGENSHTMVRYERTSWSNAAHSVIVEDALIELDATDRVLEIRYETHEPTPTAASK